MSKLTLAALQNLQNETSAVSVMNSNSELLAAAFDNTLSRGGTTPNQMEASLDMNSNRILNIPAPIDGSEPVRLSDIQALIIAQTDTIDANVYNTASAVAVANIDAAVSVIRTLGYGAVGDGGGVVYKRAVSTSVGSLTSADGAHWQICAIIYRPEMFSSTANTTAIQLAIDAAYTFGGGVVKLTSKTYTAVTQAGHDYACKLYGPVCLEGEAGGAKTGLGGIGTGTVITWNGAIDAATDIILWTSDGGHDLQNVSIKRIQFMPTGFDAVTGDISALTTYGRDVIRVTAGPGLTFYHSAITDCTIGPSHSGYSINFSNNANGDWGSGVVSRNQIWGGVFGAALLDNCYFGLNQFNGQKLGMDITAVAGSGNMIIEYNNGTCAGGAMTIRSGFGTKIRNNYFELDRAHTGTSGYLYDLLGDVGTLADVEFTGNICSSIGTTGFTGLVRLANTTNALVEHNFLNSNTEAIPGVAITSTNYLPICGRNTVNGVVTPTTGTRIGYSISSPTTVVPIEYDVALPLSNSFAATGSYEPPTVRRTREGVCHIKGTVGSGATAIANTLIATIPEGWWPQGVVYRAVPSGVGYCSIQIDPANGHLTLATVGSTSLQSIACSYMTQTG